MARIQLRGEMVRTGMTMRGLTGRLELEPEKIEQGLARLVLSVLELIRDVLERQAVRRMEGGRLSEDEVERLGLALLRLRERLGTIRDAFGLTEDDLELRVQPPRASASERDERLRREELTSRERLRREELSNKGKDVA